ncbi:glycosyltransferase [Parashewanella curva]|uniref:Glycosyltransferase n=1 Tax=Parashewanella curva TaxID=2338552 RepID=A0A3L8PZP6_9GAMM|nr:glycosyltransferase [Parashewanella curva]RLV60795.1 glycosyltransferase [Parashewanella curva]
MFDHRRIAIVINSLAGGGAEKVMLTLAQEFIKLGHEAHFFVLQNNGEYQVPTHIPLHVCFEKGAKGLDSVFKVKLNARSLKNTIDAVQHEIGKFDLFLSNLDTSNQLMTRTGLSPLYCVVHNSVEQELIRQKKLGPIAYFKMWRAKHCLSGQRLITVSKGIKKEIEQVGRIQPKSVQTIYNPFDVNDIKSQSEKVNTSIPSEEYLIHVGRVAKQKRHDILFQALKEMESNIKLVLLCNNPKKALKLAKKHGVSDRIILPGFQANPYQWIKRARALVLSSDYEGLPTVIIEALICGTPVISTNCPHGPSEILTGDLAENLAPVQDPKSLATKIDNLLKKPKVTIDAELCKRIEAEEIAKQYLSLK